MHFLINRPHSTLSLYQVCSAVRALDSAVVRLARRATHLAARRSLTSGDGGPIAAGPPRGAVLIYFVSWQRHPALTKCPLGPGIASQPG